MIDVQSRTPHWHSMRRPGLTPREAVEVDADQPVAPSPCRRLGRYRRSAAHAGDDRTALFIGITLRRSVQQILARRERADLAPRPLARAPSMVANQAPRAPSGIRGFCRRRAAALIPFFCSENTVRICRKKCGERRHPR